MKNLFLNTYLILAGAIIMLVGMYISLATVEYLQAMNLKQAEQPISLLSDLRGMGGLLLVAGGYVVLGVFKPALKSSSLWVANAVYISFVAFRSLGLLIDGLPEAGILVAFTLEIIFAVIGILYLRFLFSAPRGASA